MNKVITVLSDDEELSTLKKKYTAFNNSLEFKRKSIQKQIKELQDLEKKTEDAYHDAIMERLRRMGKYPSEYKEGDQLIADFERDCVLWHRHDETCGHPNIPQIIQMMFPPKDDA